MDTPPDASLGDDKDDLVPAFADSSRALAGRLRTSALNEKDSWQEVSAAGWLSILVPDTMGGLGLDLRHVAAVHEQLGRAPTRVPVIACGLLPTVLLVQLPQSELRDSLLRDIQSGKLVIGLAWQDQVGQLGINASSSVACNTNASGYVLQGTKRWVVSVKDVDGWLLDATDQRGMRQIFWLPAGTSEVHIQASEVIDTYSVYELALSGAKTGQPIAEGDTATKAIDHAVDIARVAQGAELIGLARASFELTLDYLKTRVQFGKPIGANQALQHRMVDAYVRLEMADAGVQSAIQKYLANELTLAAAASWAKSRGADVALMVTRLAVQLHGAIGITDEYQLGQFWKRTHFVSGWLGGAERHSARHLEHHEARELRSQSAAKFPNIHAREMDVETASIEDFREIVRSFLEQNYPPALRNPPRRLRLHELRDWLSTLARKGWLAPAWPRQYGGMGLTPAKLIAFVEEFEDFGAARTPDQGIINVGPILIKYGTDAQRRRYLPKILAGEEIWCQGYSEPGAGSDLASLRTRAELRGDHFCVNGQKIWTTLAHDATHMFMLARTSVEERKHDGISFLLVDLATKGITVRPIRNIAGEEEFCEVFLDNVDVPIENLVGEMGQGWKIGMALLGFERLFVGSPKTSQYALTQLKRMGKARGLMNDSHFCSTYGRLLLELLELKAAFAKFSEMAGRGEELPSNVSILKIWATETYTRISTELVRIADEDGTRVGKLQLPGGDDIAPLASLLNASVTTIYGGSNEIQRNILAKRVLGLSA